MQIVNNRENDVQEEEDTWEISMLSVYFYYKLKMNPIKESLLKCFKKN